MILDFKKIVKRIVVFLITGGIFLGAFNVYLKISEREVWDGVIWEQKAGRVIAKTSSQFNQIIKKDVLVSVNGKSVKKISDYQRLTGTVKEGDILKYQMLRKDRVELVNVLFQKKSFPYVYLIFAGFGFFALLYLLFFYSKGLLRKEFLSHHFSISMLLISFSFIFSSTGTFTLLDKIFFWIDKLSLALFPPVFLHFILLFPQDLLRSRKLLKLTPVYAPSIILIFTYFYSYFFPYKVYKYLYSIFFLLKRLEILFISIYLFVAFLIILFHQNKLTNPVVKNQSRIMMAGLFAGMPFSFAYGIPFTLGLTPSPFQEYLSLLLILIPISTAHALTKWKVEAIENFAQKFLSHLLTILTFSLLFYLLSVKLYLPLFINFVLFFFFGFFYKPLKCFISQKLIISRHEREISPFEDRFFLPLRSLTELNDTIKNIFERSLKIDRIYLFLPLKEGKFCLLNEERTFTPIELSKNFQKMLDKKKIINLDKNEHIKLLTEEDLKELEKLRISNVVPLIVGERCVGWVGLGKKEGWKSLNKDELKFIESIQPFVSLATENAQLWEELRERAEEMERLKDFNEEIIENLKVGVVVVDEEEKIKSWNSTAETLFNLSKSNAIGQYLRNTLDPLVYSQLFTTSSKDYYLFHSRVVVNLNSERRIYEVIRSSLLSRNNKYLGTIFIFEDITERLSIENQLMISEKLASLGLLTAGIAHEINTPLTGISSYVQLLLKSSTSSADKEIAEKIDAQIERVAKIVRSLLSFSRGEKGQIKKFPLRNCILDILTLLDYRIKRQSINSSLNIPGDIEIWGELDKLQQVFLNIISNAIDAMMEGGNLKIEAEKKENSVIIKISDTGIGIKKEHLNRIFEPFFTTKGYGRGTGLGLSISYGIIKEHNGEIIVESEYGSGTTFTIILPSRLSEVSKNFSEQKKS
ncbi:MAG: ATP-binding protein [Candidatus Aminicenantia bacterium]